MESELIGRKIEKIEVEKDRQHSLVFTTDQGKVQWVVDGDCCSESWFADIINTKTIFGGKVERVYELPMADDAQERSRQGYDRVYGYRVCTDKGEATIAFRNSSNGYYGGWMSEEKGSPCSSLEFIEITDDYSA